LFVPSSNEAKWKRNTERYLELLSLPHCIDAIDKKLICAKCFPKSGSLYFNRKGHFSVVLLARADADALFTTVHVGYFGKNSDGSMFRASTLEHGGLEELHILCLASLPKDESGEIFPYYFVAFEAFPLKINVINRRRMFNYRLTRARKIIECAFGILAAKFKIFEGPTCCKEETTISIVKAPVVLRSFIRIREGVFYEFGEGFTVNQSAFPAEHKEGDGRQRLSRAHLLRNRLADYVLTAAGAILPQGGYAS
jgi:hypothetical protein